MKINLLTLTHPEYKPKVQSLYYPQGAISFATSINK